MGFSFLCGFCNCGCELRPHRGRAPDLCISHCTSGLRDDACGQVVESPHRRVDRRSSIEPGRPVALIHTRLANRRSNRMRLRTRSRSRRFDLGTSTSLRHFVQTKKSRISRLFLFLMPGRRIQKGPAATHSAFESLSPDRIFTTCSTGYIKILPSPGRPVARCARRVPRLGPHPVRQPRKRRFPA